MTGQREPERQGAATGMAGPAGVRPSNDRPATGPEPTPMRGVWVAIVIVGGAAIVFLLLALTSGALSL